MKIINPYVEYYAKQEYDSAFSPGIKAIDMWHDRTFYGRVDEFQNSVFISSQDLEDKLKILDVPSKTSFYTLNFVSDAFTTLRNYVQKASATGKIAKNGLYSKLSPTAAYLNMANPFSAHIEQYYRLFVTYLININALPKVRTIEDFVERLKDFSMEYSADLPLTRSSYIKSRFFNPLSTGLMIDLYTVDADDNAKRYACLDDPTFNFFQIAARRHGFYIVKHMPWRIVANISSIAMQKYFMSPTGQFYDDAGYSMGVEDYGLNYAPGTATNLFGKRNEVPKKVTKKIELTEDQYEDWKKGLVSEYIEEYVMTRPAPYYEKSYLTDIDNLQLNIVTMWNMLVSEDTYAVDSVKCKASNKYKKTFYERKLVGVAPLVLPTSPSALKTTKTPSPNAGLVKSYFNSHPTFTEKNWVKLYSHLLYYENNTKLSERRKKNLDKTIDKYYDVKGYLTTLTYINDYFKKIKSETVNPADCQDFTFCQAEQQKVSAATVYPSNVTVIQNTTTTAPGTSGGGGSGGSY